MDNILQILKEYTSVLLAVIMGIYAYRHLSSFTRLIFWQLVFWNCMYFLALGVLIYQKMNLFTQDNQWVFNLHMVVEISILLVASQKLSKTKLSKYMVVAGFIVFGGIFIMHGFINGFKTYSYYSDITECILVTLVYVYTLYWLFQTSVDNWWASPEIWIIIGFLLYFACSVPYLSFSSYLNIHHPKINFVLFLLVNGILANVRYLLLALGFWLARRNAIQLKINPHVL